MANSTKGVSFQGDGLRRTLFSSFNDAGLNPFDVGTAQDPNSHLELLNVLPAVDKGLRRRWGLSNILSTPGMFQPVRSYAYNVTEDASDPTNTGQENLIISTDNQNFQTVAVQADGTNNPLQNTLHGSLFTGTPPKNFPSNTGNVYGLVSRRWFYSSNGVDTPQKVDPGYVTRNTQWNWGIDSPNGFTAVSTPGNAVSTITALGGTGTGYTTASVVISGGGGSGATAVANIHNGMITSFTVTNPGTLYTSTPQATISGNGHGAAAVVVYTDGGTIAAVLPAGYINLAVGRTYTYAYQNSITGHTSDVAKGIVGQSTQFSYAGGAATVLSPATGVIGNIPIGFGYSQIQVTITPTGFIDPQVDTLLLLATTDGGSLERLYGVTSVPLNPAAPGTINYTDTLPDTLSDATLNSPISAPPFSLAPVTAIVYADTGSGRFSGTNLGAPWFSATYNSLMFNPHPTQPGGSDGYPSILPGYPVNNGNQQRPFMNAFLSPGGTYQSNIVVQGNGIQAGVGGNFNFQISLTGQFYVTTPGSYTFSNFTDSSYVFAVGNGATYVSGPRVFNGLVNAPITGIPWTAGQNDNGQDWHHTAAQNFVINFPTAGPYTFEIGYSTANHDERCLNILVNGAPILPSQGNPFSNNIVYTGLTLLDGNLWADVDSYGNFLGITANGLPPANMKYTVLHQGRIFGTDGHSLYFSKNINEVTTSTGLITSKWEEAWDATNQLPISADNELITALKSDGSQLHIGTTKSIYTLSGDSPGNFSSPNMLFQQTGVLTHDLWSVIFAEGEPAGYMWVTPDLKVMYSDFNTYTNVGVPIYNILQNWDNNYNELATIQSFTFGPYNFAVLAFRQRTSAVAEDLIFETRLRKWYHWTVPDNGSGPLSTFVYQDPPTGYRALFFIDIVGNTTNYKLFDAGQTTDLGAAIPYAIQTTWLPVGELNDLKVLNQIDIITDDASQTITCYGATQRTDFDNPIQIKRGPIVTGPLGTYKFFCAGARSKARFYSFRFENPNSSSVAYDPSNVLDAFEVEYFPMT